MKTWQKILVTLSIIVVLLFGFAILRFTYSARSPEPIASDYLQTSANVVVEEGGWVTFSPTDEPTTIGFIFLPGGNVMHEAYAPALNKIAAQGFFVVDVPMPLNLAIFGYNKAADVIAAYPDIEHWVIGGHSLGGTMSARFANRNPELVSGLVLWAAYPAESDSLRDTGVQVLSIYGTLDGLATPEEIESSAPLLPDDTTWIAIEGGNHAQFGYYGPQGGDNPADISREEQQAEIVAATVKFLQSIDE